MDGTLLGTDSSSPYGYSWNSYGVANGSHTLTARATDGYGNVGLRAAGRYRLSPALVLGASGFALRGESELMPDDRWM